MEKSFVLFSCAMFGELRTKVIVDKSTPLFRRENRLVPTISAN